MTSSKASASVFESVLGPRLRQQLDQIQEAGTFKAERIITSPQSAVIRVEGMDKEVLNFCANNYLGLSDNPTLISEAKHVLDTHGFGLSSVRFICGTQNIHKQLEAAIAKFHGYEDSIVYASCFDANAGIFEALLSEEDAVISDALNHASIIDGIRLCKAQRLRYDHLSMDSLEERLKEAENAKVKLIVTDGAFSMDGDIAPLADICQLADKYSALVMIDECHATGFVGPTGRGTAELCGVQDRIDIINTTLGKAMGGATGGYTTGRQEIVSILRQKSRPYLFSNALAPSIAGATLKVFEIISSDLSRLTRLQENTDIFRSRMTQAGFTISGKNHPICPVMLYDAKLAGKIANDLLKKGIYVISFSFPVVPRDKARIRVQMSAGHTAEQVHQCVDAFIEAGKEYGVIH